MLHIKKIDPQRAGLLALFCGDLSSIHLLEAIWPPGAPPLLLWSDKSIEPGQVLRDN